MKSWISCAAVIAHLFAPVWALPQRLEGTYARRFGTSHNINKNDRDTDNGDDGLHPGVVLGGGALLGTGLLAWAHSRQPPINQPLRELQQMIHDREHSRMPQIRLSWRGVWEEWHPPSNVADDARWMECIYDYLGVPEGESLYVGAWVLADAISDCGKHHGRRLDLRWFDKMDEGDAAEVMRSTKRATAWAARDGQGKEVRAAAPPGTGHFRDQSQTSQFSTPPLAAVVPHWARQLGVSAQHMFARVAAGTRRLSAVNRRVLQKEATLLREEAKAAY
ncbi:MAG: hypothetical protein M1826_002784 [Phylliscum demangeonii]|nr:MAG: hypothetical protein M1826_002784 [Phylliscum demangeonii]